MALDPGTRLRHYEVVESIGVGGMGEVYRAEDKKLGREVAIKVLPEAFRQDEERLARLEREARALAALNHPNIATLYGLESDDGITYLVMELVPGDTLEERLCRGPLAIDEAIGIFRQIADALEAAHAAGIVHRDLKPANIKITPEGRVKVLDFGLAKAFAVEEPAVDLSSSPTLTKNATVAGVILGTASYMSPEQAKGKTVDKRTDIWAFGCVLFEAIAGRKAFDGESVTDVLANVIHKEVSWAALPAETSWRVRDVLRRCLTKDLQHRFHDVADARIELTEDTEGAPTSVAGPAASRGRLVAVGLLAALMGIAGGAAFLGREAAPGGALRRFIITPPHEDPALELQNPVLSPDGGRIVYVGAEDNDTRLYVRELDELGSRVIEGTEDARSPFFSPDGLWVGFLSGGKLKKVSILGGAPIDICDAWSMGPGGTWHDDNTIWFSRNWISGLFEVSADGGEPVPVTTPDPERGEVGHWWPDFLPGGQTALFTVYTDEGAHQIAALDLKTKTWRHLFPGMQAQYVSSGHIVYYWAGIYQAVSFDPSRLEIRGTAVPVLENTRGLRPTGDDKRYFDMSDTGIVVTIPGGAAVPRSVLAWLGRDGRIEPLPFDSAAILSVRLDPSGARVALARVDGGIYNVWLYDLEFGTEERLTRDANNFDPQWTPDGRRIIFTTARRGEYDVVSKPVDGLGPEEPVVDRDNIDEAASAISPNGRWLALAEYTLETGQDLTVVNLDDGSAPIPVGRSPFDQEAASFSRDSAWIAFHDFASGRSEVYVQEVVDGTGRVRVSSAGGMRPAWSPVEDELYYVSGDTVMAVRYRVAQGEFRTETPRALVNLPERHRADWVLEMSPDGERFLILLDTGEDPSPTELHLTTNWFEELKRLAPVDE